MNVNKLSDAELHQAFIKAVQDSPEYDELVNEANRRHKERQSKIPLEERKRRSYDRFVLHPEDITWEKEN